MLNIQAQHKFKCAHQQILYLSSIINYQDILYVFSNMCDFSNIHTMSLKR